jgi:adenine phosphoribosyltransferase
MKTVKDYIRTIPDFPEKGIMFRDVTSVIQDADGLKLAIDEMIKRLDGLDFDVIAGAESRGFVFGMPIAYALHKPFPTYSAQTCHLCLQYQTDHQAVRPPPLCLQPNCFPI